MKTERAAVLTAIRARDQFDKQLAGMEKGIDDANENVEKMLANQMRAAGYRREGAIWRRQSVIGSTLFGGEEWEDQHVGTYRRFTSPGFRARTDLSNKALKGLSGAEIFTLVERASEEMTRYQVLIFGRSDEQRSEKTKDGKTNAKYVKPADADEFHKVLKAILKDSREAWKTSAGASRHSDTEGLFNFHVGYRPVMKGEEVSEAGYGQMGRIMSQFMTNEARMGRGHAALMTPAYRKPMWDDDADNDGKSDGIIPAPSLATVIDITANIVIGALLPGGVGNVLLGAALNLVDDLIFATADVATGYATADQAFGALGRKALTSAVSAGVSIGGGALDGVLGVAGTFGEVASDIGIKGVQMLTTNAANSIIHNGFNGEALLDATFGQNALKGYAVGLVGAGVSSGMETAIVGTLAEDLLDARALGRLAGGLASAGMEYGLTGKTKLNVLNMADLTGGKVHGGLLELNINREGGSLFNVGQGGVGVNMHALQNAAAGFDVYRNAARIHRRGFRGEEAIAMRMLRSLGRNETDRLFGDLMSGRTILAREARLAARARTDRGEGDDKIITLGRDANGESRFGLGITLVHEAFRDGENGDDQVGETERAVLGHVDAAEEVMNGYGKRALGAAQREEVNIIRTLQQLGGDELAAEYISGKYDSSADYWKAVLDDEGRITLHNDGRGDVYLQVEGSSKEIKIGNFDENNGKLEHLADLLGGETSSSDILQMMLAQAFDSRAGGVKHRYGDAEPVSIALNLNQSRKLLNNIAGDPRVDWSKYAGVSGEGGSLGGQSWNDFQKVVDGHTTNVLDAANSQMSALKGDYWQEVEFYGLVRQMNSDALRRIDSIRVFLGREGGRLNHNFTGESADLGRQYSHMLDQATRTAQSARNLHRRWRDEGRTANVKHYQIRDAISTGLDFLPVLNDVKGLSEGAAGRRWISNEGLSPGERVITGGSSLAGLFFDGAQWARAGRRITGGTIRGAGTVRGWRTGDPITNLTRQGNVPTWDTIRRRHWKNEALYNPSKWDKDQLERMRRGLAPQQRNSITGAWESMELHHIPPQREGGLFDFVPLWPEEHAAVDKYRYLGKK